MQDVRSVFSFMIASSHSQKQSYESMVVAGTVIWYDLSISLYPFLIAIRWIDFSMNPLPSVSILYAKLRVGLRISFDVAQPISIAIQILVDKRSL